MVLGAVFMLPLDALCQDRLGLLTEGRAHGTGRAAPPLLPAWGCFCSCPFWTLRLPFWGEIVQFCVTPRLKGQFLSWLWALGGGGILGHFGVANRTALAAPEPQNVVLLEKDVSN